MKVQKIFSTIGVLMALGISSICTSYGTTEVGPRKHFVTWRPYQNYMSIFIKDYYLNQITPVGKSVREVYSIIREEYIPEKKPLYIDGILVVNKNFGLPPEFGLDGRNKDAINYFNKMKKEALKDGVYLYDFSNYRSYDRQVELYNSYVSKHGESAANRFSAKPGYSEHQSGYTSDIGGPSYSQWANKSFDHSKEAEWLANNAYKYGYILRYPKNKERITGYIYESWHYRYVGKKHSKKIHDLGVTLEEYLGLDIINNLIENRVITF